MSTAVTYGGQDLGREGFADKHMQPNRVEQLVQQ